MEEGEIVEEAEKSRLKRHKEVEHEESENKHKKKRHSHEDSDDGDRRSSSSLKNREENDKHSRQKPSSKSFSSSSNRTRESYRSRSRSLSPKESSSYSTYRDKKRAYQSFRWEKARDRSPEKVTPIAPVDGRAFMTSLIRSTTRIAVGSVTVETRQDMKMNTMTTDGKVLADHTADVTGGQDQGHGLQTASDLHTVRDQLSVDYTPMI